MTRSLGVVFAGISKKGSSSGDLFPDVKYVCKNMTSTC